MTGGMTKLEDINESITHSAKKLFPNKRFDSIVALEKNGNDWNAIVEMVERKAVPDSQDLLGRYELKMTGGKEVQSYKQISLRHRGETRIDKE